MQVIHAEDYKEILEMALTEDIGSGDVTSLSVVPENANCAGVIFTKEAAMVCGAQIARETFLQVDPAIQVTVLIPDGQMARAGQEVIRLSGPARGILTAERTALNFLQHLSGVATETRRYVDKIAGTHARLLDTRKTLPGWRKLHKYAVACGGGTNHRMGLHDLVLIKDNHLKLMNRHTPGDFSAAVARARSLYPALKIEIEAETPDEVRQALAAGADI
ncbi:carboxylating nicotinate-nucleotide diphosphorylase, partial [Kamptonema cortianum]|nr:carboxylating nicotinate-nucleotide diphosphorylase [Kamptonema cortianum]